MRNLRTSMLVMLALIAIGAAGCAGSGVDTGSELPSGGTAPSILAPSGDLEPGDSGTGDGEAADDDDDDVTDVPDDGDSDIDGSGIECEFDKTVDAEVGKAYSQQLSASGGSEDFRFEATNLPAGLSLSSSGAISGKPEIAGKQKASIKAIDIQSEADRNCSLTFTIRETITVRASVETTLGEAKMIWKLTVEGTANDNDYAWSFSPSANLCGSVIQGSWSGTACQLPSKGKAVYVWMKSGTISTVATKIVATASSAFADSAKVEFEFPSSGFTFVPGMVSFAGLHPQDARTVESVKIRFHTGWQDKSGSNCTVGVEYSDKADGPWHTLKNVTDNFNRDELKTISQSTPEGMTPQDQYFRITLKNEDCGEHSGWNLQALSITVDYSSGTDFEYKNPCLYAWMKKGESLRFGPNDTAVCAITGTADTKDAETNSKVYLLVEKKGSDAELNAGSAGLTDRGSTSIFLNDSEMWDVDADSTVKENNFFMIMDAYEYNDREQKDVTAYGDYAFDSDPFGNEIKLLKDNSSDGWRVASLEVFIFNPSTITQGESMHHGIEEDVPFSLDNEDEGVRMQQDPLMLTSNSDSELLIPDDDWTRIGNQH